MKNKGMAFFGFSVAAALSVAILSGCGGGSDDTSDEAAVGLNTFKDIQASFAVACKGWQTKDGSGQPVGNFSNQGSVTVTELVGVDRANVILHAISYESAGSDLSGSKCDTSRVVQDISVTGQIRDLGASKAYKYDSGKTGAARVVEFTYHGFTLAKGGLSGIEIPAPNLTTKVVYIIDGNQLYVGSGDRDSDGLPFHVSKRFGVKP